MEFVVLFCSRCRSLALKSSLKSHQMTTFLVQKRGLSENIIIWVKTLSLWTNKIFIWWLFNDDFRARERQHRKKELQIQRLRRYLITILKALDTGIKESTNKLQISRFPVKRKIVRQKRDSKVIKNLSLKKMSYQQN